jgi:hypothetical protein
MLLVLLNILILASVGTMPLEEAFEILTKDRGISAEKWMEACDTVDRGCPVGDEACIRRLMAIWETPNYRGRTRGPLEIACEKANDETLPIILESADRKLEQEGVRAGTPRSEMVVFGEAGIVE